MPSRFPYGTQYHGQYYTRQSLEQFEALYMQRFDLAEILTQYLRVLGHNRTELAIGAGTNATRAQQTWDYNQILAQCWLNINPLIPHDVLKHHFKSLKTDLIFLQLGLLEWQ